MTPNIDFFWKSFEELSLDDLYAIINLRQKVFVVEQNCPYIDTDYSDQEAFHLLGYQEDNLVAYLRTFGPNIKYVGSSIGRIVVEEEMRNLSVGKNIVNMAKDFLQNKYPSSEIVISAQHRLLKYYEGLEFTVRGEVYLEDDIDHIQMYIAPKE
tara:strand:- start:859 stop:1320 length:462 start_codon:yes stop_codon:yes gene_type:complete